MRAGPGNVNSKSQISNPKSEGALIRTIVRFRISDLRFRIPRSLTNKAQRILGRPAPFIRRDFRILTNKPLPDFHPILVVPDDQLIRRLSRLLPLLDDVERVEIEVLIA